MSKPFIVTQMRLIAAVPVGGVPTDYMPSDTYEITLMEDSRFVSIRHKHNDKHPPTVVPLSNVAYFYVKYIDKLDKKAGK